MKSFIYIIIFISVGYFAYDLINPVRKEVNACVNQYLAEKPFRSALKSKPKGDSDRGYCVRERRTIITLNSCINQASQKEQVSGLADFYYKYRRTFSTDLSSIGHLQEKFNEYCSNYSNLIFER